MGSISPRDYPLKRGGAGLVRAGTPDDAAATSALVLSVMRESAFSITEPDEFQPTEEQERDWIRVYAEDPASLLLVAEADGSVVGMLDFRAETRRRLAHTGSFGISVAAEWREQGVGTALIQTLLEWARVNPQIEKVCLGVLGGNERAIHVYQKLGFVEEGRRPGQIKMSAGHYVDEILMYRLVKEQQGVGP
jgi:RimJ/RimL family protein N-acetyltransferase